MKKLKVGDQLRLRKGLIRPTYGREVVVTRVSKKDISFVVPAVGVTMLNEFMDGNFKVLKRREW